MRNFLKRILSFILFVVILYPVVIVLGGIYLPKIFRPNILLMEDLSGHMLTRLKDVKETKDVDILFLGSSHTYRGFDPRIFKSAGYSSFNLGSSAQTPLQTNVLLKRYLNNLNPALVIYEVYPSPFTSDGVESALELITKDKIDYYSFKMAVEINDIKVYNTFVFSSLYHLIKLSAYKTEPICKKDDCYISGGYVEKELGFFKHTNFPEKSWNFKDAQFKAFEENLAMLKARNVNVILVYAPITPSLNRSYNNNQTFDSLMNTYGPYYNFNKIMSLDDSLYFFDSHHLNQNGVEKFNNKLIEVLNEDGIFPIKSN